MTTYHEFAERVQAARLARAHRAIDQAAQIIAELLDTPVMFGDDLSDRATHWLDIYGGRSRVH